MAAGQSDVGSPRVETSRLTLGCVNLTPGANQDTSTSSEKTPLPSVAGQVSERVSQRKITDLRQGAEPRAFPVEAWQTSWHIRLPFPGVLAWVPSLRAVGEDEASRLGSTHNFCSSICSFPGGRYKPRGTPEPTTEDGHVT